MRNIEMHFMDSNGDVDLGVQAGLIAEEQTDSECDNCSDDVGHVSGVFYPYVVALDERAQWKVCEQCANGVLDVAPMEHKHDSTSYEAFESFISDAND